MVFKVHRNKRKQSNWSQWKQKISTLRSSKLLGFLNMSMKICGEYVETLLNKVCVVFHYRCFSCKNMSNNNIDHIHISISFRGVNAVTTVQLHSTKPELMFKSWSRFVGDSRWWGSLTIVPTGNKAFVGQPYLKNTSSIHHQRR